MYRLKDQWPMYIDSRAFTVIALESNISSFRTQSHCEFLLYFECKIIIFYLMKLVLLRCLVEQITQLCWDLVWNVMQSHLKFNLQDAISHNTYFNLQPISTSIHFVSNSQFHFKNIVLLVFTFIFFFKSFNNKKGPPTINEFGVIFQKNWNLGTV